MDIHQLYHPILSYFRRRRMREFSQRFAIDATTRILDVGGGAFNWQFVAQKPRLTLLNLSAPSHQPNWVVADGRHLPFVDKSFDIVYSNSVVEHLGTYEDQRLFAVECQRVGRRYYVQTPSRTFPVEPHLITPLMHWLPRAWQQRLLTNYTVWGLLTRPTQQQCQRFLDEVRLLDYREMCALFPEATVWRERFLGLTKSLIAVNTPVEL